MFNLISGSEVQYKDLFAKSFASRPSVLESLLL
jgi:hypothetical protein